MLEIFSSSFTLRERNSIKLPKGKFLIGGSEDFTDIKISSKTWSG